MKRLFNYLSYRRNALNNAWQLADMQYVVNILKRILSALLIIAAMIYWMSDYANASAQSKIREAEQKFEDLKGFHDIVKSVAEKCLTEHDMPIWIEREPGVLELGFCGLHMTGITQGGKK